MLQAVVEGVFDLVGCSESEALLMLGSSVSGSEDENLSVVGCVTEIDGAVVPEEVARWFGEATRDMLD